MRVRIRAKESKPGAREGSARFGSKRPRRGERRTRDARLEQWDNARGEGESIARGWEAQQSHPGVGVKDPSRGHDFSRLAIRSQVGESGATEEAVDHPAAWLTTHRGPHDGAGCQLPGENTFSEAGTVDVGSPPTKATTQTAPPSVAPVLDDSDSETVDERLAEQAIQALFDRATTQPAAPLPKQRELEARLGQPLGGVEFYTGPRAAEALDELDAQAAARGSQMLGRDRVPDTETIAHELVHVLQSREGPAAGEGVVSHESPAEQEARRLAPKLGTGERAAAEAEPPVVVEQRLSSRSIALRRSDDVAEPPGSLGSAPDEALAASLEHASAARQRAPAGAPGRPERAAGSRVPEGETVAGGGEAGIALEAAEPPGAGGVAEEEVGTAEGEAALREAADVSSLMLAFAEASPTVKARQANQLGQNVATLAAREGTAFSEDIPEIDAVLNTEVAEPPALSVRTPEARDVSLEETPPPPAPDPEVTPTADPEPYRANDAVAASVARAFGGETEDRARQVGASLNEVQTTDPEIDTSPGPPPAVPLEGESDPQRIQSQAETVVAETDAAHGEAQAAVLEGPGPEQVQPIALEEAQAVGELTAIAVDGAAPVEGPQQYLEMPLPPEVRAGFDQDYQEEMQANLEGARTQAEEAAAERDRGRDEQVTAAQDEAGRLSQQADRDQRSRVLETRREIQDERQSTLDAQQQAVADAESGIESRRAEDRNAIDQQVEEDERAIRDDYSRAEEDARSEVRNGERRAENERAQAEREADNESWWDKATSFVRRAFEALTSAISAIFDAVRAAINTILDAVKAAALALIDAAAAFIKRAIEAFGNFLRSVVDTLLGDLFPGLAAALNEFIDSAVARAQAAVDQVAERLKAGVAALVDGLRAGLNALLDIYQGAINAALALAEAALTGDWAELARKVLESVLGLAGIDPEQFYALIGRAMDTFHLIIDDPLGFVGNLLDAFLGGVRQFADNILTHLRAGIIAWLTGTLGGAGITLPDRFDLAGVFSLVRQILGLTWDRLREKAVRLIGERAVAMLEFFAGYVQTLITEGWAGLWERIKQDLASLRDTILNAIKEFIVTRIIVAAVTKLATMFNPVGAIVQLVLTAWNIFTFIRDQLQRLFALAQAIVEAISNIAQGILGPAMNRVEGVLASLLPLALDLLARILGLGNIGAKVREIVERVREAVDQAIDRLIERVKAVFRRGEGGRAAEEEAAPAEGQIGDRLPIEVQGEPPHFLYVEARGAEATVILASAPTGLAQVIQTWRGRMNELDNERRAQAEPLLQRADSLLEETDREADIIATARARAEAGSTAASESGLAADQQSLAGVIQQLFPIFAVPPTVTARRFEEAVGRSELQGLITTSVWSSAFDVGDRQAQSDLAWGRDNGRLEEVEGQGREHTYTLKRDDGELIQIAARTISSGGRASDRLRTGDRPFFTNTHIREFCVSSDELPGDEGRYGSGVLNGIGDLLLTLDEITPERDGEHYVFREVPAQRWLPDAMPGEDVRRKYYIVGSGFDSARSKVLDSGFGEIERAVADLASGDDALVRRGLQAWRRIAYDPQNPGQRLLPLHPELDSRAEFWPDNILDLTNKSNYDVDHREALAQHWERAGKETTKEERRNVAGSDWNLRRMWASINRARGADGATYVRYVSPSFASQFTEVAFYWADETRRFKNYEE